MLGSRIVRPAGDGPAGGIKAVRDEETYERGSVDGGPPEEQNGSPSVRSARGEMLAQVSNSLVRLHSEYYGRGPTKAKTYLQEDVLCSVLSDIFTTVEKTLIDVGRGDHVRETRHVFQLAMEKKFCEAVEAITGRRVRAFLSQTHIDPDVAVEVFLLEPE
jgi:uncharacterized protein YbcI